MAAWRKTRGQPSHDRRDGGGLGRYRAARVCGQPPAPRPPGGEIPQQTGIKEAIDLNTRMMGEAVSELIKNNQLLALQSYGMGMSDVSIASAWAQEQQMLDFTMPDLQ
ncbi:hypothetical protein [Paracoccus marcusii]|uniref:hypothetical protein n=1 Tax=Paracoccus marcusii TaxID=59779 RepID=UPI0012EF0CBA